MSETTAAQEERIQAQRSRIEKRKDSRGSDDNTAAGAVSSSAVTLAPSAVDQRASDIRYEMAGLRSTHVAATTNTRVTAEVEEAERRQRTAAAQAALTALQEDSSVAAQHGALNLQFEALYRIGIPHDLHNALEAQQRDCASLIDVKEKLIAELRGQLKEREIDYVQLLRKNKEQVNQLVDTIRSSTDNYIQQYTAKQAELEKLYEAERKAFLDKCAEEVKELVKTRRTKETEYRRRREQKLTEAQAQLEERYEAGYEDFNDAKREHQFDVHGLRAELEKSKADYLLNGERLMYNLQVLRERVKENRSAQAQYKKMIARLQETLATLLARYQDAEKRFQRTNTELTTQLHRVDQQYTDTQSKFAAFEKKDKKKYKQLWKMHHDKCQSLAQECLQADRVVYEDLLRMPWQPPVLHYWPREEMEVEAPLDEVDDQATQPALEVHLSEAAQMLFAILKSQAPFLVDANVREAIRAVEGTTEEQADVEGILATLHLNKTSDVEDMLEYFLVEHEDETVALINPQEALKALKAYLSDRQLAEAKAKENKGSSPTQSTAKASPEKRQRDAEKAYWRNMAETVPKDHLQVWEALEDGLSQYLAQLQQRKQLITDTDTLRAQNEELRDLIRQYMHSDINYELHAPPRLFEHMMSAAQPRTSSSP
jgi:dynein regulatry complex protein 1